MLTTRLEAIMFTDIAGYSRLMEQDEDRTIELLKTHNEIVFPVIEADEGEVISSIGDGLLVVFPSVRRAVECANTIHRRIAEYNDSAVEADRFKLRIGIHLGEVQHEGKVVYGTGVNVAARVQPFALPGGVCITEDVQRHVERKIPQRIESIGRRSLKSITREYELFRVVTGYEDADQDGAVASTGDAPSELGAVSARPSGELDEVKERILSEIAKWSEQNRGGSHGRGPGRRPDRSGDEERAARTESKVFGIVEHVMDKAIEKWDGMPEEKQADIIHKIKVGIDEHSKKKEEEKASKIAGEIVWGTVATAGMGLWYSQTGSVWMIIVGVLIGVFPLISGIQKLVKNRISRRSLPAPKPTDIEGSVLKAAKELGGRVTVVQMAAQIGRPLDEVQSALDAMTSRGYVIQEILESGVVRYDFPALFPDDTGSRPIG